LDDQDTALLGLMGDWKRYPDWLTGALAECIARAPLALIHSCEVTRLIGLLESALRRLGYWNELPAPIALQVRAKNLATEVVSQVLWSEGRDIDYVCGGLGIEPVFLKGYCSSLLHYDEIYERPFRDIDLLVPEDQAITVYRSLQRMGYVAGYFDAECRQVVARDQGTPSLRPDHYELPRLWKLVPAEVGSEVARELSSYDGKSLFVDGETIWVPVEVEVHYALTADRRIAWRSQVVKTDIIPRLRCLDWETQLITATTKAYTDLVIFKEESRKLIADALRVINRSGEEIDWPGILERAYSYGVSAPMHYVLQHASKVFGLSGALEKLRPCCTANGPKPLFDFGDIVLFLFDEPSAVAIKFKE